MARTIPRRRNEQRLLKLPRAAAMIERNFDDLVERAEGATVDRWVAALPARLGRTRTRLLLAQAVWMILSGRLAEAEQLIADAERALEDASNEPG